MEIAPELRKSIPTTPMIEGSHTLSIGEAVARKPDGKPGNTNRKTLTPKCPPVARNQEGDNDLEIESLKEEFDSEVHLIQGPIGSSRRLRPSEFEEERNDISDKFVDKVNTINISRYPGDKLHSKVELIKSRLFSGISAENVPGFQNSPKDNLDALSSLRRRHSVRVVPVEALQEEIVSGRCSKANERSTFPDTDRPVLSVEYSSKVTMEVQETIGACFSSIQLSLENLRNKVKLHDMRGNVSSRHGNEEIEDELFTLEKAVTKLREICQDPCRQVLPCKSMNHHVDGEKVGFPNRMDIMSEKLSCAQQKIKALDDKVKQIDELKDCIQALSKDKDAEIEKYEVVSAVREMCKEAAKQRTAISQAPTLNENKVTNHLKSVKWKNFDTKADSHCRYGNDSVATDTGLSGRFCRNNLRLENESLRNKNEILKLKLSLAEFQLSQQEATLERLISQSRSCEEQSSDQSEDDSSGIMTRDSLYETKHINRCVDESEKTHQSLQAGRLRHPRSIPIRRPAYIERDKAHKFIDELDFKLQCMNTEFLSHMQEMRAITSVL